MEKENNNKISFNTKPDDISKSKQALVYNNFNQDDKYFTSDFTTETYETMLEMYYEDGKIAQAVDLPVHVALDSIEDYFHPNQKIIDFVQEKVFSRLDFENIAFNILSSRWAGVSVSYVETMIEDNLLLIKDIFTIDPETYIPTDGIGTKNVLFQTTDGEKKIRRDNLIIHTSNKRFSDPYGNSLLFTIGKFYERREAADTCWRIFLEKFGVPFIFGWINPDASDKDKNTFFSSLVKARAGMTAVSSRYWNDGNNQPDRDIEFKETSRNTTDFQQYCRTQDRNILTALGVSSILFTSDESGSYSLGSIHYNLFKKQVRKVQVYLRDIILNRIIAPLLIFNFGEYNPGDLTFNTLEPREFKEIASGFKSLSDAGFLNVNDEVDVSICKRKTGLASVAGSSAVKWNKNFSRKTGGDSDG